ncbi:putative zinc-binding metallopeptidase [Mangrovibacterium diazotrophicum]|uniref:Putative zinc-binding metallo-peptidase n=1 Tax=Mangrovibacterium diazotrophicum TaxID=1261403 RepID=A0A419WAR2_9BACT|nr:putative zinc-binding metallopeptidase [Mangrovibacterium diazotrophicum]RKD92543.1 putative zinc-binding metallo-peptidase [Mangrovibacterium diazotrophicum]
MKIKNLYTILAAGLLLFSACVKEEGELEPSGIEDGYTVPQGTNDFDATIVDYYNRFGSCLLYEFTEKDVYWTPSKWQNGTPTSEDQDGVTGLYVTMPDLDYIAPQLDLLDKTWFSLYNDQFLKEFLPVKIMLCDTVAYCDYDWSTWPATIAPTLQYAYYNYDNISVGYANEAVLNMTSYDTLTFARAVNRAFIESMAGRDKLEPTTVFVASTSYANVSTLYNNTDIWGVGVFQPYYQASPENDWQNFVLMMVLYSEDYLNREVSYVSEWDWEETSWEGIFTSQKDVNGMMKKRYDIVRNYYIDNYGIDLQEIGNTIGQ